MERTSSTSMIPAAKCRPPSTMETHNTTVARAAPVRSAGTRFREVTNTTREAQCWRKPLIPTHSTSELSLSNGTPTIKVEVRASRTLSTSLA